MYSVHNGIWEYTQMSVPFIENKRYCAYAHTFPHTEFLAKCENLWALLFVLSLRIYVSLGSATASANYSKGSTNKYILEKLTSERKKWYKHIDRSAKRAQKMPKKRRKPEKWKRISFDGEKVNRFIKNAEKIFLFSSSSKKTFAALITA